MADVPILRLTSTIGGDDFALLMHAVLGMVERYGWTLRSRLVSEEDVELILEGTFTEETHLIYDGAPTYFQPGDWLRLSWKLHSAGPRRGLAPEIEARFR